VNEARFGYNSIDITFDPNALLNPQDFGIHVGVNEAIGLPQITIQGIALNFGGPTTFPQGRTDTTFVFSDAASYLAGHHALKLGGEFRRFKGDSFTSDPGTFQFPSVAAFQTGLGNNFTVTLGDRPADVVEQSLGLFAQDNIRVGTHLTVDVGLRYDLNLAPTDDLNRFVVFDAPTSSLVRLDSGRGVYGNSSNLQPRGGVVFDPKGDGLTIVRGAYALMVDQPVVNMVTPLTANPPLAVPLIFAGNIRLDSAITTAGAAGLAPSSVDPNFENARIQTWNVNVERQVGRATAVMIGYFGSKGDRLRLSRNINQLVNGVTRPYPTVSASSAIRPGAALGNITEVTSLGWSNYKGLWLTANQRVTKGLQFNASYTLSKSTDTNSLNSQGAPGFVQQNSLDLADSEGLSDYDARHRFVVSAIYDLPFSGNRLVDGWQVGVITQAQTGNPLNIVTNINQFTGVANTLRPDLIGDPAILGSPNQWFSNTVCDPRIASGAGSCSAGAVFALPVSANGVFHFGNLPRNAVIGPGFGNTDLSFIKNIAIQGTARAQFRLEVFNLFNQANFGQPGRIAIPGSTAFGLIANTRFPTGDSGSARQMQLAAKFLF